MTPVSARAQIITRRTYSRPLDGGGFEAWPQTIDRVVGHQAWLWERAQGGPLTPAQREELEALRRLMLDRRSLPAGRTLWLGGTELVRRREASMFNCAYLTVRTVHDVVDAFWLLLQGCGTGFAPAPGVLCGFTRKMDVRVVRSSRTAADGPADNAETYDPAERVWTVRVGDSAEAWAKAVGKVLAGKFPARTLVFDLTAIRPAGSRLKGYGWVCSGDASLATALAAVAGILNRRAGKLLGRLDILDIVNWLGTVLSSRRSAQIALAEYGADGWRAFADAKTGEWWRDHPQRAQSNNSLVFPDHPGRRVVLDVLEQMHATGGGDPGLINGAEARRRAPWFAGVNPCVPADTWVTTADGPRRVADLIGRPFTAVVDGRPFLSAGFVQTGVRPLLRVRLANGVTFRVTDNHRVLTARVSRSGRRTCWVEAGGLSVGDRVVLHNHRGLRWDGIGSEAEGYLLGNLLGDGCFGENGQAHLDYWGQTREPMRQQAVALLRETVPTRGDLTGTVQSAAVGKLRVQSAGLGRLAARFGLGRDKTISDAVESASSAFTAGFIRGYFDADGSVCGAQDKGLSVRLPSVRRDNLHRVQRMLARLGVNSVVYDERRPPGSRLMPDGRGGSAVYPCRALHELVIANDNLQVFADRVGFTDPAKRDQLAARLAGYRRKLNRELFCPRVVAIDPEEAEAVYDCAVPGPEAFDADGAYVHNCAEILLSDKGFCNLCTTDLGRFRDDHPGLLEAIRLIGRANYRQTVVNLRDGVLQDSWHQQNEYLRLCGVSLTGYAARPDLTDYDLRQLRQAATAACLSMADELGLERPKNVTTGKPEGTLSKVMDATEGCHVPLGRFVLNNVGFSRHDPALPALRAAGYRVWDHPTDPAAALAALPVSWEHVPAAGPEPAVAQLDRYRRIMRSYCDQNQSVTVSYDEAELPAVADWLDRHWDDYVGVSFLRRADPTKTAADLGYPYLPQEVVTEAVFREYVGGLKPIDLDATAGSDLTVEAGDDCSTGACPVR